MAMDSHQIFSRGPATSSFPQSLLIRSVAFPSIYQPKLFGLPRSSWNGLTHIFFFKVKIILLGAGEMTWQLGALAALSRGPGFDSQNSQVG